MAAYDSPGFTDRTPGGPVNQQAFSAPGSAPPSEGIDTSAGYPPPTSAAVATVTIAGASTVNADRVPVGASDTLVSSEAQSYGPAADPLTGLTTFLGETGAGAGHTTSRHPNSTARP